MLTGIVSSRGFLKRLDDVGSLPVWSIDGSHLPEDVLEFVEPLLDLRGTYGDPDAGDPIQYDHLLIEHDQGEVEIVVYNRAVLLFRTDSEAVKRTHRVCCRLDDISGSRRPA